MALFQQVGDQVAADEATGATNHDEFILHEMGKIEP
jgi:hypothetical protein